MGNFLPNFSISISRQFWMIQKRFCLKSILDSADLDISGGGKTKLRKRKKIEGQHWVCTVCTAGFVLHPFILSRRVWKGEKYPSFWAKNLIVHLSYLSLYCEMPPFHLKRGEDLSSRGCWVQTKNCRHMWETTEQRSIQLFLWLLFRPSCTIGSKK